MLIKQPNYRNFIKKTWLDIKAVVKTLRLCCYYFSLFVANAAEIKTLWHHQDTYMNKINTYYDDNDDNDDDDAAAAAADDDDNNNNDNNNNNNKI